MKLLISLILSMVMNIAFAENIENKTNTVVLVHGAFADGSAWNKVIPILQAKGIKVISVQNPLTSLADDSAAAKRAIDMQKGKVLLVGHSWGGVVISDAGNNEKVSGLVFVAAFAPGDGETANSSSKAFTPGPGLAKTNADADGYVSLTEEGMEKFFAQDVPKKESRIMMSTQGPIKGSCFDEQITNAAWKNKPNWYIVAKKDLMINPEVEKAYAKKINATTTILNTSHVPMASKPKEVANVIMSALNKLNTSNYDKKSALNN